MGDDSHIVLLEPGEPFHLSDCGPKAQSLCRLIEAGLPVPPAFCVSGKLYREVVYAIPAIARLINSLSDETADAIAIAASIRTEILQVELPDPIGQAITEQLAALGAEAVAVRSSASAEDLPGHSFAGQYDSYLNVRGPEAVADAIKQCWASLWTDRAVHYRQSAGFDHRGISMAVMVQTLIPADASGVLFTADPVSGNTDRIIIESCFGLGEGLVSGKVTPDRMVVDKQSLTVLEHVVSGQAAGWFLNEDGGTVGVELPSNRGSQASIDAETARALCEGARRAEAFFGAPQDMEWAYHDGRIHFLQSRAITTLPAESTWAQKQFWTNANAGEVMPDVVTPLTWDLIITGVEETLVSAFELAGLEIGTNPLFGRVAGRVYFNMNTVAGAINALPFVRTYDFTKVFGGMQEETDFGGFEIPEEDWAEVRFRPLLGMRRSFRFLLTMFFDPRVSAAALCREAREKADSLRDVDPSADAADALLMKTDTAVGLLGEMAERMVFPAVGMMFVGGLDKISQRWFEQDATIANRLMAGMGGMDSAEAGLGLWSLAESAHGHSAVLEEIRQSTDWEGCAESLSVVEGGREFLEAWDEFMDAHGHHTRGEIELANLRWREDRDYVLHMVRGYLDSLDAGGPNPVVMHAERAREREELTRVCRKRLRNPFKRAVFNFCLARAQRGAVERENVKSAAVYHAGAIRDVVLRLGEQLVRQGRLENSADIFFLERKELDELVGEEGLAAAKTLVASRRREHALNESLDPPPVVIGEFDPSAAVSPTFDGAVEVLEGIAVSPGVVTGPARVVLRADTDVRVAPGEILVAPFTDPGWTPYFLTASAIVMDMGGILSHGSIVAREYGIPAVVNVGSATRIIETGQTITVDGRSGKVYLQSEQTDDGD